MKKIVFATNNLHKLDEVRTILKGRIEIVSLSDIGCEADIPETAETLEGNASLKAAYIHSRYGVDCFADDTGLEVEALDGKPGVYSARYAGENCNANHNMQKLLYEMAEKNNRNAQFRTVISLLVEGKEYFFEGAIRGQITYQKQGEAGFGYDPIFVPEGYDKTLAELGDKEKNRISHRAQAVTKLCHFLTETARM